MGIVLNSSALGLFLIAIFSHRLSEGLVKLFVKILKFFRVKNIEEKQFDKIVDLWCEKINVWNTPNNFKENMKELERLDSQLEMLNA